MPTLIPSVTKNPHVHFPSTWKDAIGKPLTDSAIRQYAREGFYGPDEKRKQEILDRAKIVEGVLMLSRPCERCNNGKTLGDYMRFSYLPHSGYYCNSCREHYKHEKELEHAAKRKWHDISAFD